MEAVGKAGFKQEKLAGLPRITIINQVILYPEKGMLSHGMSSASSTGMTQEAL
jgi:hypothetical protein